MSSRLAPPGSQLVIKPTLTDLCNKQRALFISCLVLLGHQNLKQNVDENPKLKIRTMYKTS